MSTELTRNQALARSMKGEALLTGDVLSNGWTVVDVWFDRSQLKFGDVRPMGYVLAMLPGEQHDKFATWWFVMDEHGVATTAGHYFPHIFQAAKDLARRIGTEA